MNVRFAGMLTAVAIAFAIVLLPLDLGEIGLVGGPIVGLLGWVAWREIEILSQGG